MRKFSLCALILAVLQIGLCHLRFVVLAAIVANALMVSSSAGATTFGDNGVAIPPIYVPGGNTGLSAIVHQSDGKLVVAGTTDGPISRTMFAARFAADGSLDTTYGVNGIAYVPIPEGVYELVANAAVIDDNDNLVLAGGARLFASTSIAVARLRPDGTPDPSFAVGGFRTVVLAPYGDLNTATRVALDSQGRIVLVESDFAVVRLMQSGVLDPTFNGTGVLTVSPIAGRFDVQSVATDANDNILLAGVKFTNPPWLGAVARLTASGQVDLSFNGSGFVTMLGANAIAVDGSGRILVAAVLNLGQTLSVTRLDTQGVADPAFGVGGTVQFLLSGPAANVSPAAMTLDGGGRIVIAATAFIAGAPGLLAVRFSTNGVVDAGFNGSGMLFLPNPWLLPASAASVAVGVADEVVVGSIQMQAAAPFLTEPVIARLTTNGSIDTTFNGAGSLVVTAAVKQITTTGMVRQPDGKLVIVGYVSGVTMEFLVARLTLAGTLDPAFNGSGYRVLDISPANQDQAFAVALDGNQNIVVAGSTGNGDMAVARLSPVGALDTSFNGTGVTIVPEGGVGERVIVAIDGGDRIVFAGLIGVANGVGYRIVRLTSAGVLDPSFAGTGLLDIPISSVGAGIAGVAIDSAGRIVVGGWLYDGSNCGQIVVLRLLVDGTLDSSFAGTGKSVASLPNDCLSVAAIAVDSSDRIVLGGFSLGGISAMMLARLTSAGSPDSTLNGTGFVLMPAPYFMPTSITLDGGGNILIAGDAYLGNTNAIGVQRFIADGTVDPSFNAGALVRIAIFSPVGDYAAAIQVDGSNGKIYVAGTTGRAAAVVNLFGGVPTTLAVMSVNGGVDPLAKTAFPVRVQAQDDVGGPQEVLSDTSISLSLASGTGALGGALSCVIPMGNMYCDVPGATYSRHESNVVVGASVTSGGNLDPATSAPFTVDALPSTTDLATSPNPSIYGQDITFTVTVTGVDPTGIVEISIDSSANHPPCVALLSGSGKQVTSTCTLSNLSVGMHNIVAYYQGDNAHAPSQSLPLLQTVNPALNKNVALAANGGIASASSTFSSAYPVSAVNNGDRAGLNFGNGGVWRDATPSVFPDWVEIDFNGYQGIDRVVVYSVQDNYLAPVDPSDTLTFTQRGLTDFDVQWWNGSQWFTVGSVTANNLVKRTVSFPLVLTSKIRLLINGAAGKKGASSYIAEIEAFTPGPPPAPGITLASSRNPAKRGQIITFAGMVTGTNPTGTIAFKSGATIIPGCGQVALSGAGNTKSSTCTTSFATAGNYSIVATYGGDAANPGLTSTPLTQMIKKR